MCNEVVRGLNIRNFAGYLSIEKVPGCVRGVSYGMMFYYYEISGREIFRSGDAREGLRRVI